MNPIDLEYHQKNLDDCISSKWREMSQTQKHTLLEKGSKRWKT